jgi:hypothetical protein
MKEALYTKAIMVLLVSYTIRRRRHAGAAHRFKRIAILLMVARLRIRFEFDEPYKAPEVPRVDISADSYPAHLCWPHFRVRKVHLHAVMEAFGIRVNTPFVLDNRSVVSEEFTAWRIFALFLIVNYPSVENTHSFHGRSL